MVFLDKFVLPSTRVISNPSIFKSGLRLLLTLFIVERSCVIPFVGKY